MCGILGYLSQRSDIRDSYVKSFDEALQLVSYRGPNGQGFWCQGQPQPTKNPQLRRGDPLTLWLGHKRLSIIDLSENADQPMGDSDFWIIFNGEIYNYLEIKKELQGLGHRFRTVSDTEVALKAFQQWGEGSFARFNGMWAMAIWDAKEKTLTLSRDRMGVKPLYYSYMNGEFVWGSEIKQLLYLRRHLWQQEPRANLNRVYDFLTKNLIHHGEDTLYDGIFSLRPGHFWKIKGRDFFEQKPKRYWDFPSENDEFDEGQVSFEVASQQLAELMSSAVALRLRSDVPVGSALSGGLDSSTIVSLIKGFSHSKQKTFSAVFPGAAVDESKYARMVVKDSNVEAVFTEPTGSGLIKDLDQILYHQDGPFVSTSIYAQWEVFRAARRHDVTVMLDGQGADEILGGYEGFFRSYIKSTISNEGLLRGAMNIGRFASDNSSYFGRVLKKKTMGSYQGGSVFTPEALEQIQLKSEEGSRLNLGDFNRRYGDPLREALYRATVFSSLPSLLHYEDRSSMAFSVESRTPFLDYRIVEFCFRCPSSYLVHRGERKSLLREATKGLLPEAIRTRKDKIGFATPEGDWIPQIMNSRVDDLLENADFQVFDRQNLMNGLKKNADWRIYSYLMSSQMFLKNNEISVKERLHDALC